MKQPSALLGWLGAFALAALMLPACGGRSSASAVAARVGDIEVLDAYLPDPASPSVAALYLTVRNTGAHADALIGASSPISASASMHSETADGMAETMTPIARVPVPAHGEATLAPGHDHVMLEALNASLRTGETVPVTLRFARAGTVVVRVPVVPLDAAVAGMAGMAGMK